MTAYTKLGLKAADLLIDHHFEKIPDRHFDLIPDALIFPQQTFRKYRRRLMGNSPRPASRRSSRDTKDRAAGGSRHSGYDGDSGSEGSDSEGAYAAQHRSARPRSERNTHSSPREAMSPSSGYFSPPHPPPYRALHDGAPRGSAYMAADELSPPQSPSTWSASLDHVYQRPPHEGYSQRTYSPPRSLALQSRSSNPTRGRSRERDSQLTSKRRSASTGPSKGRSSTFSTSEMAVGISSFGALAGGFLSQEISVRSGKGDPALMTLLGAAIGGLGGNILEGRHEKKKEERKKEEKEEKERRKEREKRERNWSRDGRRRR